MPGRSLTVIMEVQILEGLDIRKLLNDSTNSVIGLLVGIYLTLEFCETKKKKVMINGEFVIVILWEFSKS